MRFGLLEILFAVFFWFFIIAASNSIAL